jgi:hypothetical protein
MPSAPADVVAPPSGVRARWRVVAVALSLPTIGCALGINGGDLFQMVAVEDLGLDARVVGIGLGFGVLSVPVQLWAARLGLARVRQRLVWFLLIDAVLCWALALVVVVARPGGGVATAALGLAVLAEVSLSVLYATSWQPLLSLEVGAVGRQRVNGQARAVARALMVAVLLGFGVAGEPVRVVVLVALGGVATVLAGVVHRMPVTVPTAPPRSLQDARRVRLPEGMGPLLVTAGLANAAMWPLFVTFTHDVLWPDVNLGIVATAAETGTVIAGLLWRATTGGLVRRARRAVALSMAAAVLVATLRAPVDGPIEGVAVVVAVAMAGAATATLLLVIVEQVHRMVDHDNAVRSLTVFDVVVSTSFQVALAVAGLLVAGSVDSTWPVDPYRLYLLASSIVVAAAVHRSLRPHRARRC